MHSISPALAGFMGLHCAATNLRINTMKTTISSASQFREAFYSAGRKDQFSYEALGLLFDYLEEADPDMELDVVGICCDYSEDMPESIAENYSIDVDGLNDGEILDTVTDYLEEKTTVVGTTSAGAIIYQQF
jgi:hypothetical protein